MELLVSRGGLSVDRRVCPKTNGRAAKRRGSQPAANSHRPRPTGSPQARVGRHLWAAPVQALSQLLQLQQRAVPRAGASLLQAGCLQYRRRVQQELGALLLGHCGTTRGGGTQRKKVGRAGDTVAQGSCDVVSEPGVAAKLVQAGVQQGTRLSHLQQSPL